MGRYWPNCEPKMVIQLFSFAYYFIFKSIVVLWHYETLAYLQFPSYLALANLLHSCLNFHKFYKLLACGALQLASIY